MAEAMQESEDHTQIARENGAAMTERERASISRERKVARTSGMYRASRMSNPMTKPSVQDRIKECPDHHFACVKGQLRCVTKKTIVQKHLQSRKHLNGIANIKRDKAKSRSIEQCQQGQVSGATLPTDMRVVRVFKSHNECLNYLKVVETLLMAGIPISKINVLRPLFEKYAHSLTASTHVKDVIPSVLAREQEKVMAKLQEVKEVLVIFDGTARLAEALAIIVRYVQEDFKPTQRLMCLGILAKPMKGVEHSQRLMSNIAVKHNFASDMVLAAMRDGASVNGATIRQLLFFYPNILELLDQIQ